jgi:Asp-tRNA(Asn)/Glu-tRNA(Gln) amidotransferase A subunit family amidase
MINVCPNRIRLTLDDPEKYEGGPVGLQVIGRRFEEEKILEILEIIAQIIGKAE